MIIYEPTKGVGAFVEQVAAATPIEIIEVERRGINSLLLKDLSRDMHLPVVRIYDIVGIPKATAETKVASKEPIAGAGGQAALGLAKLLAITKDIVANSTAPEAKDFDAAKWLGQWIERPQPALGGRKRGSLPALQQTERTRRCSERLRKRQQVVRVPIGQGWPEAPPRVTRRRKHQEP